LETLFGNTVGLKPHQARALRALYGRSMDSREFVSIALSRAMCQITKETGRRIGVLVDRRGEISKVVVGDAQRVFLPDLGRFRAGEGRFRGVRLVLTSLRPNTLTDEDLTDLALLRLDAIVTVYTQPDGLPGIVHFGYLMPPDEGKQPWRVEERGSVHGWKDDFLQFIGDLERQFAGSQKLKRIDGRPGALCIGVTLGRSRQAKRKMEELVRLTETAGFQVLDTTIQNRNKLDGRTFIGSGKLEELLIHSMHLGAEALVFDRELSPSQLRNIATATDLKVLDRTQIILDIFAQHAQTRSGKLQVELAQLRYRMPRVAIMPTAMSRLTGGIGGRGPGETKLEINRRRAHERLNRLEKELSRLSRTRATQRKRRTRSGIPVVAIVGYTNAGKSTLLNRVTRSAVLVEDKLFATLDTTTRRFRFPEDREIILSDTVGFIEDLPKTLVQAFKSTLEELDEADLLLHVMDASDPNVLSHLKSVEDILRELGLEDRQVVRVWNKAEAADPIELRTLLDTHGGLAVSALTGEGLRELMEHLEQMIFRKRAAEAHASQD